MNDEKPDLNSLINAEFIVNQLVGADDDLRQRLVDDLAGAFAASQRSYNQQDVNQSKVLRVLQSGSPVTTDTAGLTKDLSNKSLAKTLDFRTGAVQIDPNNHEIFRILAGSGTDCMPDIIVSSCWTGTEGQSFTTLSGCTLKLYSHLFGTGYALAAAQATGGTIEIYICGSETITTPHNLDTWKSSTDTNIIIEGPGGIGKTGTGSSQRVTLTATACDMLQGLSQATGATLGGSSLLFKNVEIVVTGSNAFSALEAEGVSRPLKFWFEHVNFNLAGYLYTNARGRPTLDYELQQCTGTINQFFRYANGGAQTGYGDLTLRQSSLTTALLFDQGSTSIIPNFYFYDSDLTLTAAQTWLQTAGVKPIWYWDDFLLTYSGGDSTTALSGPLGSFGGVVGGTRIDWRDVSFYTGNANVVFLSVTSGSGAANSLIKFGNVRGFAQATEAATFITVDTGYTLTQVGVILAGQWTTPYSGPTGSYVSAPSGEAFVTIGNTANLSAERAATAGNGIAITDGGANSTATWALGNLTGNWSPTGAFDITTLGKQTSTAQIASGLTGAVAASRYVGATASGAPVSGTFAIGDFIIDQTGKLYICTVAGSPGTWVTSTSTVNTSHELLWFSQTPVTGDNLAYIPIRFNGSGATAVSPLQVRAKDYGYGTTTINLLRAPNSSTVAPAGGLPNPNFTSILTSDLNIESSHMTMTGIEDVTITGGAISSTTLAFDDILRTNVDSVNNMVNMAVELTVTV